MTPDQRRYWLRKFFEKHPYYQFGQKGDSTTEQGSEGCTHTNVQALLKIWFGKDYTQDQISEFADYKPRDQGFTPIHLEKVFKRTGLPYRMLFHARPKEILEYAADFGPVLVAVQYKYHPEWFGARYMGKKATGEDNGYARPLGKAGKNQLTGFDGGHSEIVLGPRKRRDGIIDVMIHDPNHRSIIRPEEVPWERVTLAQFAKMFNGYAQNVNPSRRTVAAVPTEVFNGRTR